MEAEELNDIKENDERTIASAKKNILNQEEKVKEDKMFQWTRKVLRIKPKMSFKSFILEGV